MKIEKLFDTLLADPACAAELDIPGISEQREAFRVKNGWEECSEADMALVEYTNEVHKLAFVAGFKLKAPADMSDVWAEASNTLDDVQGQLACCIAIALALYENLEEAHSRNTDLAAALLNDLNRLAKDTGLKHDALCRAAEWKRKDAAAAWKRGDTEK